MHGRLAKPRSALTAASRRSGELSAMRASPIAHSWQKKTRNDNVKTECSSDRDGMR